MGCDIHPVIERKYKFEDGTEKWVGLHAFDYRTRFKRVDVDGVHTVKQDGYVGSPAFKSRNYPRFAALAGVRGNGPAPKGFPKDASDLARMLSEYYGNDGHSHSWCSLREAIEICLKTESDAATVFLNDSDIRKRYPADYFFGVNLYEPSNIDDYRVLFYFDN